MWRGHRLARAAVGIGKTDYDRMREKALEADKHRRDRKDRRRGRAEKRRRKARRNREECERLRKERGM